MIEVGRHSGIKNENERVCHFYPKKVENEFHFLFECDLYNYQRKNLIDPITNRYHGFTHLTNTLKIDYLMADMEYNLCKYIANCFDIRAFLESNPKRTI